MNRIIPALAFFVLAALPAQAKQLAPETGSVNCDQRYLHTCAREWQYDVPRGKKATQKGKKATHQNQASARVLPHPSGCPRRAFCGCGAAVRVFGRPIRQLWLAANWFKFPPASPAPGMVAVRRHHVFVIESVIDHRTVVAYDANSGRHLTRRHVRSLAGYSVRDPRRGSS